MPLRPSIPQFEANRPDHPQLRAPFTALDRIWEKLDSFFEAKVAIMLTTAGQIRAERQR
jgi:hypothetical protein